MHFGHESVSKMCIPIYYNNMIISLIKKNHNIYLIPFQLLLYAEGTRFTPEKAEACQKFAKEKNLPILKYHLTPRTKGFTASIPHMRNKVPAIYDIQLGFKSTDTVNPTVNNLLIGNGVQGHLCIRRIPMEEVPEGEEAASKWLHNLYQIKVCIQFYENV